VRITNFMVNDRLLRNLQAQNRSLNEASAQVATGARHENLSEDPVAGAAVLRADRGSRAVQQYRRSVTSVQTRLASEESSLDQVTDILARAQELATAQGGSTANGASRATAAVEVQALIDQTISIGNLRVGNEFVFGGTAIDAQPFQADGTYVGTALGRQAEIGANDVIDTVHSGQQLLVDSGVLSSLIALRDALTADSATGIRASLAPLGVAFDSTQRNLAEVGARTLALENAGHSLEALSTSFKDERSANADIPLEEAAMHLAAVQSSMQAAMLAASRILNTSLTDYLR
jgi:flagellar hook-associated protein 3 FlgL